MDACLGIDDSGSEYGPDGTDPTGLRYAASQSAVNWLEGVTVADRANRVAVAHFGSEAPPSLALPLTPVTTDNSDKITSALTAPQTSLGATNIAAVIARCQELLESPTPGRSRAILVFTDGNPDLGHGPTAELFAEIDAQIRKQPDIPVTVIRQDAQNQNSSDLTVAWKMTAVKMVKTLPAGDLEQNLSGALVDALSQQIGVLPAALGLADSHKVATFQVPSIPHR